MHLGMLADVLKNTTEFVKSRNELQTVFVQPPESTRHILREGARCNEWG